MPFQDPVEHINRVDGLHEFGALNTLLFVIILGMCIVCAYLIKEYRFYYLPESGAAILVGLIVGAWYVLWRCFVLK